MRPVIFPSDATDFSTNGFGPLDCISCLVTEERNGIYELEARLPVTSPHFENIEEGNIIVATHDHKGDRQPFQIYKTYRRIDRTVEVYAEHISYRLNKNTVMPYTANDIAHALSGLRVYAVDAHPFQFYTDMSSVGEFRIDIPRTIKSCLYGEADSIIDQYSAGDYEFDVFDVHLWKDRGENNGVTLRYGKNITDLHKSTNITDVYTAVVPFWKGTNDEGDEVIVCSDEVIRSEYASAFPTLRTIPLDMTEHFDSAPDMERIKDKARRYLESNVRRQIFSTISVNFVELSKTDQYKDFFALEAVNLCDTVSVVFDEMGINDNLRVSKVVYNVLTERNEEVTVGDLKKTLSQALKRG